MWGLFSLCAGVIEICVLWLMLESFWYCRQWTHLTWCFSVLKQVVDPRGGKKKGNLQPSVHCALYLKRFRALKLFINNKKVNKGIYKILQHLSVLFILSIHKIGRIYQIKAKCKPIPNCFSIAWTSPISLFLCCLSCEPSDFLLWSVSWLIKAEKGKHKWFCCILLTGSSLTPAKC